MGQPVPAGGSERSRDVADSLTSREWDQLVDLVVERIEDRIDDELARRGRRSGNRLY